MLTFYYKTKKELKSNVGAMLDYTETSLFGREFEPNGSFLGTNHPKRSWFAKVTMKDSLIVKVE